MSLSLSHWYPGSGVVLDCIDSWSLHPYLLSISFVRVTLIILHIQINKFEFQACACLYYEHRSEHAALCSLDVQYSHFCVAVDFETIFVGNWMVFMTVPACRSGGASVSKRQAHWWDVQCHFDQNKKYYISTKFNSPS